MRIGGSLALLALGAILKFAVATQYSHGVNIGVIGVILMIVGAIGLVMSALWMSTRRRTDVIQRGPAGSRTTTYVQDDPMDAPY